VRPRATIAIQPVDEPCNRGNLYFSQEELDAFVWDAHRAGLQVRPYTHRWTTAGKEPDGAYKS